MAERRVAVTAVGLISPMAVGTLPTWEAVKGGRSGIGPITRFDTTDFPTKIAGEVRGFDATQFFSKKYVRQMDLFIQYSVAASFMCMQQSGLDEDKPNPERFGAYVGAGLGGITTIQATHDTLRAKGPRRGISAYFVPAIIINLAPGQISLFHDCKGPSFSHVSACSTGAHSLGEAWHCIRRGDADLMFAGGTESTITDISIGGFNSARALSTRNDEPTKASRPFDKDRDGFVLSEGCGLMILEEWEHAKARGATILGEMVGYAANSDAHHITAPSPGGEGAARCMKLALDSAALKPEDIGYINAHGTSTVADALETNAIRTVFGDHAYKDLAVSSTKSIHGHLLGAAGGLEAGICCMALREGILPPTINLDNPDPECDLDYVPHEARKREFEYAMSNSFGFGGTNATLIFRKA